MTPLDELLTTGSAAAHMGVSVGTIRRWAKAGLLPYVVAPSGRFYFRSEDLAAAVRKVEVSKPSAA